MADPNWATSIPEAPPKGRARHLPTHEDCSQIDVEAVSNHLRKGGTLGRMTGYEERPGQIDMVGAIATAFNARQHLMIEAGTGVGKSLAYLVPAITWAWTNDTPVVISTATRNLQSQLMTSDIPRALQTLGDQAKDFKVALLKGRINYVCLKSVDEFFASGFWTLSEDDQRAMPKFIQWLTTTHDGNLDDCDIIAHTQISRPGDECMGRKCPFHTRCFIYKARQHAAEAHLVIVNHALVLAEATSPGAGILPAYAQLILDEAHNLEDIATDYLSAEFSQIELNRIVKRLLKHHKEAAPRVASVLGAAEDFLSFLGKLLPPKKDLRRYDAARFYWEDRTKLKELQSAFEQPLIDLVHYLNDYCETIENDDEKVMKLSSDANRLLGFANEAAFVVAGEKSTHAYWIERVRTPNRRSYIRLVAAPISVADDLRKLLYEPKDSVILCSATLRVGNDFKYMARRLGTSVIDSENGIERFRFVTANSPFDYFRQSLVLAPDCLPDPSTDPDNYAIALGRLLKDLFNVTEGRALVLFTSYEMMNAVAATAHQLLAEANITLLVQGEGLSRESMTKHLKTGKRIVLFGAQSFWEGVDVAGEALSCVVLSRLPFAQVGDPIIEARGEALERDGKSPFRDYALPEAVIKFRQGFGRLIRTKSDSGVVVVTDPRIVTKNYGVTFRKSIPATVHTITSLDELLSRVSNFICDCRRSEA